MSTPPNLIFIHGLYGTSRGVKATLLRERYPHIVIPDFRGDLETRMEKLEGVLSPKTGWLIIGSSFGGLMGALYAFRHPERVRKLVLFAPAIIWGDFPETPLDLPVVIIHGRQDEIVPLEKTRDLAARLFTRLDFRVVDDDHGLYKTVHALDWDEVLFGGGW